MKIYDISGEWKFRLDSEKTGIDHKFYLSEFDDTIALPDTVSAAKKSPENNDMNTGYLTDPYFYEGYAWYSREISVDDISDHDIYTLLFERTRITHVWIDDIYIGTENTINGIHRYDISEHIKPSFRLTVMTSNTGYPTGGGHLTSPDTQTNWNGILGRMEIVAEKSGVIENIMVSSDINAGIISLSFNYKGEDINGEISSDGAFEAVSAEIKQGENSFKLKISEGADFWSDLEPELYTLKISLSNGNEYSRRFGISSFKADGRHFTVNGDETLLRGKHDGMIFPMTGYAPTDVDGWLKVMKTAKEYGINHYRFHTCCPPDAAFTAADMLGIYMEPELPFWGTIQAKDEPEFNAAEQDYLISEGMRIVKEFSYHPSFVMMSLGNELWGSAKRLGEIINIFRCINSDILYTSGSNNFQFYPTEVPEEDFYVAVRFDRELLIRGSYAMCDAPQGFVQTTAPNTVHSYDPFFEDPDGESADNGGNEIEIQYGTGVKKVKASSGGGRYIPDKPVLSHEVGQYCTYPDYSEIDKYTGVLKARNYEVFRQRLIDAGMGGFAAEFTENSGKLAAFCYKLEIEAARRSRCLAGYQLLDIQDFTGQGTAVVGILNSFMEPKGIISREDWLSFNGETVLLAEFDSFVKYDGDVLNVKILCSDYGRKKDRGAVTVSFGDESVVIECGIIGRGVTELGNVSFDISADRQCERVLKISCGDIYNEYHIYILPRCEKYKKIIGKLISEGEYTENKLTVTSDSEKAMAALEKGGNVLLVTDKINGIESTFCTDFWCYPMFRSISESMNKPVPVGTLGLSVDNEHEALAGFASERYSTPLWYNIAANGKCAVLDGTGIKPVVRTIDNFERNHNLSLLFEAVCKGNIIVCSMSPMAAAEYEECAAYFGSIFEYAVSDGFAPETEISSEQLKRIISE